MRSPKVVSGVVEGRWTSNLDLYSVHKLFYKAAFFLLASEHRRISGCRFSPPYLETLTLILGTPARRVTRLHSSGILAFDLTGQHQDKRFYVGGIIWPLGFADVIFRVERETTTESTSVGSQAIFLCARAQFMILVQVLDCSCC